MTHADHAPDRAPDDAPDVRVPGLPAMWSARRPVRDDTAQLSALLRRYEAHGRGWPSSAEQDVLIAVSGRGHAIRHNVVVVGPDGRIRAWASAHDRAAGRLVLAVVVDPEISAVPRHDGVADKVAKALFVWGDQTARQVGARHKVSVQQIDSGAFADDARQHRWLEAAGFRRVRSWWQMSRPVTPDEVDLDLGDRLGPREGVRIRPVQRQGSGMPVEDDLRIVHDVLESAFADHFNSHEETFDEFVSRLREEPGHRWDHWWIAELVDSTSGAAEPAGALVASVLEGEADRPDGSYVEYIGVLANARGRGVAKSLLATVIADAARRGRDRVGLEVDADSPTGAEGLYVSFGWQTRYVTESWHREVAVGGETGADA